MYPISYFLIFYAFAIVGIIALFAILLVSGFFSKITKQHTPPKSSLDFLVEQVQNSNGEKEILDSVMKEFYANFYTNYKGSNNLDTWLNLLQAITMLDYMTVEQASKFRDELTKKNPSIKKEIENSIGISLKYRKANKNKRG